MRVEDDRRRSSSEFNLGDQYRLVEDIVMPSNGAGVAFDQQIQRLLERIFDPARS